MFFNIISTLLHIIMSNPNNSLPILGSDGFQAVSLIYDMVLYTPAAVVVPQEERYSWFQKVQTKQGVCSFEAFCFILLPFTPTQSQMPAVDLLFTLKAKKKSHKSLQR